MKERDISRFLAEQHAGRCEVRTPVGLIDVLTSRCVYEVKESKYWKAALGQVLSYQAYYPEHQAALYLYGASTPELRRMIKAHCAAFAVKVEWHQHTSEQQAAIALIQERQVVQPGRLPLSLTLSLTDHDEHRTYTSRIRLTSVAYPLQQSALEAYADEVYDVLNALLAHEFMLTLEQYHEGERLTMQRSRTNEPGPPAYFRLRLGLLLNTTGLMTIDLPGVRVNMPSGQTLLRGVNYAGTRSIPELMRLEELIVYHSIQWCNRLGGVATRITKAERRKIL